MGYTRRMGAAAVAVLLGMFPAAASSQVSAGRVQNFEDGSTQGWMINLLGGRGPFPVAPPEVRPANVATGGPGGAGDNFLQLTSTGPTDAVGPQPGSRVMALNPAFWGGNYLSAGITGVSFAANNFGPTALSLRFLIEDATTGPPTNIAVTAPFALGVGSGWQTVQFSLRPGDLTPLLGTVNGALSNATIVRIYHSPGLSHNGPQVMGSLGLDNITALSSPTTTVPEPSTFALLGAGGLGLLIARRRRSAR